MKLSSLFVVLLTGVLFGFGLALSTMTQPEVVLSFLRFEDFGLLFVLGGAASVTAVCYQLAPRVLHKPILEAKFGQHHATLDTQTLGGAALFGIGWGISGVCPGPAIASLGAGNWPVLFALAGLFAGAYVQGWLASRTQSTHPGTGSIAGR